MLMFFSYYAPLCLYALASYYARNYASIIRQGLQRGQSRALKEAYAQELHDVWVAEGAHQLTFPHKLGRRLVDFVIRNLGAVLKDVVDLFNCGAYRYRHLLHAAVGSSADSSASEPHVGEHERPQLRVVTKKICCHYSHHQSIKGSTQTI